MVLSPFIFKALTVLIVKATTVRIEADHLGRSSQHLLCTSTRSRHFIEFGHGIRGEEGAGGRVLNSCREIDVTSIRRKAPWKFTAGVGGKASRCPTLSRHDEEVEVAVAVAGESYLLTVGTPHGVALVRLLRSEPLCFAAYCGHFIDITFVAEGYLRAIG